MKKMNTKKHVIQIDKTRASSVPIIANGSNMSKMKTITGRIFDSTTLTIISGVITCLIFCLFYFLFSFMTSISTMQKNIEVLGAQIDEYSQTQAQMEQVLDNAINQSVSISIEDSGSNMIFLYANDSFSELINKTYSSEQAILDTSQQTLWKDKSLIIGKDMENSSEYTVNDLMNESIVTAYVDQSTGETVVFKGQFDECYYWNGNCIMNRYKDNKLVFVMDAEYLSGELIRYKQVFPCLNAMGNELWMVSERKIEEYKNKGETWSYFKDREYEKNFEIDSLKGSDIVTADSIRLIMSTNLEGYYNGYTSDGFYNDDTGQAYLVKYTREGYIRILYAGKIKNGVFEDETNNAWYIAKSENTNYMYYKGEFHNGTAVGNAESIFLSNISIEEINKILQENNFNTGLNWYVESK